MSFVNCYCYCCYIVTVVKLWNAIVASLYLLFIVIDNRVLLV